MDYVIIFVAGFFAGWHFGPKIDMWLATHKHNLPNVG